MDDLKKDFSSLKQNVSLLDSAVKVGSWLLAAGMATVVTGPGDNLDLKPGCSWPVSATRGHPSASCRLPQSNHLSALGANSLTSTTHIHSV